jgi:catechol-2,3-dioxygenase
MARPGFSFGHFGLFACDVERLASFYARMFDFTLTERRRLPGPDGPRDFVFLTRDPDVHHQLVFVSGRERDVDFNPIQQISLQSDTLQTLCATYRTLKSEGVADMATITHGNTVSIYLPDPEGNRLELYFELPWYTHPVRVPIELGDEATLMERLEAHARTLPGFRPRAEWRAEMARRMGPG